MGSTLTSTIRQPGKRWVGPKLSPGNKIGQMERPMGVNDTGGAASDNGRVNIGVEQGRSSVMWRLQVEVGRITRQG